MRRLFPVLSARRVVLALLALAAVPSVSPASDTGFLDRVFRDETGEHRYVVFVPRAYTPRRPWPVILYLHGAAERGADGRLPVAVGLGPLVREREATFPFLVVFPQAEDVDGPARRGWLADTADARRALAILDEVEQEFRIDRRREILTGWSMGGYGAWSIAAARPRRFEAVVPVSGGTETATAARLKDVPVWAIHGGRDRAVPPAESRDAIAVLETAAGQPRYTELADVGHDAWRIAYDADELFDWMLDPRPAPPGGPRVPLAPRGTPRDRIEPFAPAIEIPGALTLRLGEDALEALAMSAPQAMGGGVLSGRIPDIQDSTVTSGRAFNVWFRNIDYRAAVDQVKAEAVEGRLHLFVAVRDAAMTIGSTYVQGRGRSAATGPMSVVIGHRQPVWLRMAVRPRVEDGRVRLDLTAAAFDIAADNWYVTPPAGINTQGLFMTRERVSHGLVEGLYSRKDRIEREVTSIAPRMLAEIERQLDFSVATQVLEEFWPLPVYQPRMRVRPQAVSADSNGLTLTLALTAAAVDPRKAPRQPRRVQLPEPPDVRLESSDLVLGVSPGIYEPLTDLVVEADAARLNVLDLPQDSFARFADRTMLAAILPELGRLPTGTLVRSVMQIVEPLEVAGGYLPELAEVSQTTADSGELPTDGGTRSTPDRVRFVLPRVLIQTRIKTDPAATEWTPLAEMEFSLTTAGQIEVESPAYDVRRLRLAWSGEPQVTAAVRFADDFAAADGRTESEAARLLFLDCWQALTASRPLIETDVPDIDLGYSKLRLAAATSAVDRLAVTFAEAGVRISNLSEQTLVYESRGANKPWGGPFRLEPGKSHEYNVPYPMLFRRSDGGRVRLFTLAAGSHSEFRLPRDGGSPQLFQAE